ncbi:MAG: hypothetical protein Unbinned7358contig1000_54 [Prokaryotic dsDNA virus sp.]|nr:MAG: hypothetical protein Unbinned7358contig1000_54 [Prokaryotic dsDNA virus sp.]|tara:strand:- start:64192 stop:64518 length:327 start_codon:yes stop_codon:yes gene_type:complete
MTLYCVQTPWSGYLLPGEYPDCFQWFSSGAEARAYARESARDEFWDETAMLPVNVGDMDYRGVVVWKVTMPRLSPKKLALWMSRNATLPCGEAVYLVEYAEKDDFEYE